MAQTVQLQLSKQSGQPWGFRLQGGKDFNMPLVIQKVNGNGAAEQAGMRAGDAVISVAGKDVISLRHKEVQDLVISAGNSLEMTVQRGGFGSPRAPSLQPSLPKDNQNEQKSTVDAPVQPAPVKQPINRNPFSSYKSVDNADSSVKSMVHSQFNSPLSLYSEEKIAETLSAQAEVLSGGAMGVNFKRYEPVPWKPGHSDVLRMLNSDTNGSQQTPPLNSCVNSAATSGLELVDFRKNEKKFDGNMSDVLRMVQQLDECPEAFESTGEQEAADAAVPDAPPDVVSPEPHRPAAVQKAGAQNNAATPPSTHTRSANMIRQPSEPKQHTFNTSVPGTPPKSNSQSSKVGPPVAPKPTAGQSRTPPGMRSTAATVIRADPSTGDVTLKSAVDSETHHFNAFNRSPQSFKDQPDTASIPNTPRQSLETVGVPDHAGIFHRAGRAITTPEPSEELTTSNFANDKLPCGQPLRVESPAQPNKFAAELNPFKEIQRVDSPAHHSAFASEEQHREEYSQQQLSEQFRQQVSTSDNKQHSGAIAGGGGYNQSEFSQFHQRSSAATSCKSSSSVEKSQDGSTSVTRTRRVVEQSEHQQHETLIRKQTVVQGLPPTGAFVTERSVQPSAEPSSAHFIASSKLAPAGVDSSQQDMHQFAGQTQQSQVDYTSYVSQQKTASSHIACPRKVKFKWPPDNIDATNTTGPLWYDRGNTPEPNRLQNLQTAVEPVVKDRGVAGSTTNSELCERNGFGRCISPTNRVSRTESPIRHTSQAKAGVVTSGMLERSTTPQPTLGTLADLSWTESRNSAVGARNLRDTQNSPLPHLEQRKAMVAVETAAAVREGKASEASLHERLQQLDEVGNQLKSTMQLTASGNNAGECTTDGGGVGGMQVNLIDFPSMTEISRRRQRLVATVRSQSPVSSTRSPLRPFDQVELSEAAPDFSHETREMNRRAPSQSPCAMEKFRWRSVSPSLDKLDPGFSERVARQLECGTHDAVDSNNQINLVHQQKSTTQEARILDKQSSQIQARISESSKSVGVEKPVMYQATSEVSHAVKSDQSAKTPINEGNIGPGGTNKTWSPLQTEERPGSHLDGASMPLAAAAQLGARSSALSPSVPVAPSSCSSVDAAKQMAPQSVKPGFVATPPSAALPIGKTPNVSFPGAAQVPAVGGGGAGGGGGKSATAGKTNSPRRGRGQRKVAGSGLRIPVCSACSQQIRGPFIAALGQCWCPGCFVCSTAQCHQNLENIGFVEVNEKIHCENCWETYLAPTCSKCQKRIKGDCLKAVGTCYHPECFACAYCGGLFGNSAFFMEDGLPYCENDWNELFTTKCVGCGFPIEAGDRWVEALNKNFHAQCFKCAICGTNLEGQSFLSKQGRPFCKHHARM